MKFKISLFPAEDGFAVCVPSLPGCWSQGATEEEALANIASAIQEYRGVGVKPKENAEVREVEIEVEPESLPPKLIQDLTGVDVLVRGDQSRAELARRIIEHRKAISTKAIDLLESFMRDPGA